MSPYDEARRVQEQHTAYYSASKHKDCCLICQPVTASPCLPRRLADEVVRLSEAADDLRAYAKHTTGCKAFDADGAVAFLKPRECSCGLVQAIAAFAPPAKGGGGD